MSQSDDQDPPAKPDEPSAGQIVRGEVSPEQLDPVTIAELARWFGAPAASMPAPSSEFPTKGSGAAPPEPDEQVVDDRAAAKQRAIAAADPEFLERLESQTHAGDAFIKLPAPPRLSIETDLSVLDMGVWRVRTIDTIDRERPFEVYDALRDPVPQAILRDLHRPTTTWPPVAMETQLDLEVGGATISRQVRELMGMSYRVRMDLRTASRSAYAELDELRARLDEPWDEIEIIDDERSRASFAPTAEDMKWFGSFGYDPTA